jgi:signal peptidase II
VRFVLVALAVSANLVLADAVVKELAAGFLKGKSAIAVIPGFFNLAYVENRGCAWGMLQGQVWPLAAFGIVALIFLIWKRKAIFGNALADRVAEILLYAGIIGNLIDRVCRGYVIDMFDFYWKASHFPCFNLADAYISAAAGIMVLCSFVKRTS